MYPRVVALASGPTRAYGTEPRPVWFFNARGPGAVSVSRTCEQVSGRADSWAPLQFTGSRGVPAAP